MALQTNIVTNYFTGEDKTISGTIYQSDGSTAQNITGWSLSWMVKRHKLDADANALVTKTTSSGIALTTPLSGVYTITIADEDIANIVGERLYHHELKRTDVGAETVLAYGTFTLSQAVHR